MLHRWSQLTKRKKNYYKRLPSWKGRRVKRVLKLNSLSNKCTLQLPIILSVKMFIPQVMNLQDRNINIGIEAAEAPFELNIPRPETRELDDIIKALESQVVDLGDPDEGCTVHYLINILTFTHCRSG